MMVSKFMFKSIFQLCLRYEKDILERKPLAHILDNRKVRFINPRGRFEYTTFGNFYFAMPGHMMLITKERDYAPYHQMDKLYDTLWFTVPVIFAGVEMGAWDDTGRMVYTGDVVTADNDRMTSVVWCIWDNLGASLLGDNCSLPLSDCQIGWHIEGTAFSNLTPSMFEYFDYRYPLWPTYQYCYMPELTIQDVIDRAQLAKDQPHFLEPIQYKSGWLRTYIDIEEEMTGNFCIVYLVGGDYRKDTEETYHSVYADNFPKGYEGELYDIVLDDELGIAESFEKPFYEFVVYAHNHPETKFIICDFKESLIMNPITYKKVADIMKILRDNNICNVMIPIGFILQWLKG